ncbi:LysR family transcriptional regulator [Paracidovorax avenae]|uniref:LysR family transcriptional regulator n=1 Tax=Paracidovorax avenae TaxID=80867 RepID=UPI000D175E04|nr:LysR substrate-binding domain-containing protein [Paracidovorax avenae]AVS93034.1 LysR family transcriptional regulator [Paracidovorax avenae]AVT00672.1 LysR family transcriptional regulator [Paracidovorax avenae]AVT22128.1 LysR family transcriptional regulator [Paracidovorax avenae]
MQLKWVEDFIALARERSFTRAAEQRHVTHPAFGRRIRALEAWAGTALVERGSQEAEQDTGPLRSRGSVGGPVRLTAAGTAFLATAEQLARELSQSQEELRAIAGRQARSVTIATGRTLARTALADALPRLRAVLQSAELRVVTNGLAQTVEMLERGEADFWLGYHHAALEVRLDGRSYAHATLASDKLVPVSRADAQGLPRHALAPSGPAVPYLAYADTLALGRLVEDLLARHPLAPRLRRIIECDSADAQYEYVHRGLGVAWLPWSMVRSDCQAGRLAPAGERRLELRFDVRLVRPKRRLTDAAEAVWQALARS